MESLRLVRVSKSFQIHAERNEANQSHRLNLLIANLLFDACQRYRTWLVRSASGRGEMFSFLFRTSVSNLYGFRCSSVVGKVFKQIRNQRGHRPAVFYDPLLGTDTRGVQVTRVSESRYKQINQSPHSRVSGFLRTKQKLEKSTTIVKAITGSMVGYLGWEPAGFRFIAGSPFHGTTRSLYDRGIGSGWTWKG